MAGARGNHAARKPTVIMLCEHIRGAVVDKVPP